MSRSKGAPGSGSKGQSLRSCPRGRLCLCSGAKRLRILVFFEVHPVAVGSRCESSVATCLVASWHGCCWWVDEARYVRLCAMVCEAVPPCWGECADERHVFGDGARRGREGKP